MAGQPSLSAHEDGRFATNTFERALTVRAEPMDDQPEDEQVDDIAIRTEKDNSISGTALKAQREDKLRKMMNEDGIPPWVPRIPLLLFLLIIHRWTDGWRWGDASPKPGWRRRHDRGCNRVSSRIIRSSEKRTAASDEKENRQGRGRIFRFVPIFPAEPHLPGEALIPFSDKRRASLGVVLWRGARGSPSEETTAFVFFWGPRKEQYEQAWTRKHHVFLLKEVITQESIPLTT